jgi:hypothetical protein
LFVYLVDEKAGTKHLAILVEKTHDKTRGTVLVLYPEFQTTRFVARVPLTVDDAYIDDDGKHGQYLADADSFPDDDDEEDAF